MDATVLTVNGGQFYWNVRVVRTGDKYGLNFCLTHEGVLPLVEFYDTRYDHTQFGQFVSRYNLETLLKRQGGLCLYGGVADWVLDDEAMATVHAWLSELPEAEICAKLIDMV